MASAKEIASVRNHLDKSALTPLAIEILTYLEHHPRACDTLVGIARWWILRQRIEAMTHEVKAALDQLVSMGVVAQTAQQCSEPRYALTPDKLESVQLLLAAAKSSPPPQPDKSYDQNSTNKLL